jgi:hypothetical protein
MPRQKCDQVFVADGCGAPEGSARWASVRLSHFEGELIGGTNSRLHLDSQGDRDLVRIAIRIAADQPEEVRARGHWQRDSAALAFDQPPRGNR